MSKPNEEKNVNEASIPNATNQAIELTETDRANIERYNVAVHAIQCALGVEIDLRGTHAAGANPKHLRTGINSAMVNNHALATLLMNKGLFTKSDYLAAIADSAEQEADSTAKNTIETCNLPPDTRFI